MNFTNPAVDARYKALTEKDPIVARAGIYSGKLSGINEKMAEGMVKSKSNLIVLKDGATPPAPEVKAKIEKGAKKDEAEAGK